MAANSDLVTVPAGGSAAASPTLSDESINIFFLKYIYTYLYLFINICVYTIISIIFRHTLFLLYSHMNFGALASRFIVAALRADLANKAKQIEARR